jgi:dTMP kinase
MNGVIKRGALIVFEGCDRSGKTTQVQRLVNRFIGEGAKVRMMRFPDRTTGIGSLINQYLSCSTELDDHVVHLLFSANRWEMAEEMKRAINSGITIIVDRYAYSGVAFSAAKERMNFSWCKSSDVGLPKPDLVCFLNVSEEVALMRADFGGERYEKKEFQNKVRANYKKLEDCSWVTVEVDRTMDEVHDDLYQIITAEMKKHHQELGQLWVKEL